jgi:AsmA protein
MQEIDPTIVQSSELQPRGGSLFRRFVYVYFALLVLLLLALIPPLVSVNRYQRRIATSISGSLGRPVHLDNVTLSLLPLPGFTLENLVVGEDPAFGSEPVIRANSVRATLRISSLWRKRVEFSTISFTEPSVNLVHLPNGKWNLESILLQAARIPAAPTGQLRAGEAPRFPYIEATGARLNLKLGDEKTPLSLTDAEFALWLQNPQEWRLRLQARPIRTDTNVSDTGTLQLEGTLGHAASLGEVPIKLQGEWKNAPLGEASRIFLVRDMGWRGEMTLTATVNGTVGQSAIQTRLRLNEARRADFVPERRLAVDVECQGTAAAMFHSFENIRCSWPPAGSSDVQTVAISGEIPDVRRLSSGSVQVGTAGIPASTLLDWLRVFSPRVPQDLIAAGKLTGSFSYQPGARERWSGEMLLAGADLHGSKAGTASLVEGDVVAGWLPVPAGDGRRARRAAVSLPGEGFVLAPASLALGGKEPAVLEGRFDADGYTLHLSGMASYARLTALAEALPQLGDGLVDVLPTNRAAGPFRIDLTATREWGGMQVWRDTSARPGGTARRKAHL